MASKNLIDYRLAAAVIKRILKEGTCRDADVPALETFVYEAKALAAEEQAKQPVEVPF